MAYNSRIRQNSQCCDGWEHLMGGNQWMCGKTHGACDGADAYSTGGQSWPRRQGYIADNLGNGYEDDVPALLTAGEYVLTRNSTQKYGEKFLNRLNQGLVNPQAVVGLNKGGRVKSNRRNNVRKRRSNNKMRRNVTRSRNSVSKRPRNFQRGGRVNSNRRFANGGRVQRFNTGGFAGGKVDYAANQNPRGGIKTWLRGTNTTGAMYEPYSCPPNQYQRITGGCYNMTVTEGYALLKTVPFLPPTY